MLENTMGRNYMQLVKNQEIDAENLTLHTWWFKVTFLGWLSDPFKGLSDLQLGDQKVTLNHLVTFFHRVMGWLWGSSY